MMTTEPLGLYVHIPFCMRKCRYCDFCSFTDISRQGQAAYVDRLIQEIRSYKRERPYTADTVFFGGGTPSLLSASAFERIMDALQNTFRIDASAEITLEANPKTLTYASLAVYRACGVNRMSLGLQSINENEKKILGRIHTSRDFFDSVDMIRAAGVENINVDIMYGIPDQTLASFTRTVDAVLSVKPTHISAYSLILEEGTPLYEERERLTLPDEDTELAMLSMLVQRLAREGLHRYEISNYSLKGFECRHNSKYWAMAPYLGFGLAAHSCFDRARFGNPSDMQAYLTTTSVERQPMTRQDEMYEYAMLHLRTCRGFSLDAYRARFGVDFRTGREATLSSFIRMGYMCEEQGRLFLTDKGLYVSNSILTEIL